LSMGIDTLLLAGYDWGGRAACILAVPWPGRVACTPLAVVVPNLEIHGRGFRPDSYLQSADA
jgi:hypothetical protein